MTMISINDGLFILWMMGCFALILTSPGKIPKNNYSKLIAWIFLISCLTTIWFHETVIDVSELSPIHGALLAFAQLGILTLTSKLWLSINYAKLSHAIKLLICVVIYTCLFVSLFFSYWLYKFFPEAQLLLYPLAGAALSISAQILEDRWK
jgi:hypothetical protein